LSRVVEVKLDSEYFEKIKNFLAQKGIRILKARRSPFNEFELEITGAEASYAKLLIDLFMKDERMRGVEQFDPEWLRSLSLEKLENYVEQNIVDLKSAKAYLKKLTLLVLFLYKKLMEGELS